MMSRLVRITNILLPLHIAALMFLVWHLYSKNEALEALLSRTSLENAACEEYSRNLEFLKNAATNSLQECRKVYEILDCE